MGGEPTQTPHSEVAGRNRTQDKNFSVFFDALVLSSLPLMLTSTCIISLLSAAGGRQHVSGHILTLILHEQDRNQANLLSSSGIIWVRVKGAFRLLCRLRYDLEKTKT